MVLFLASTFYQDEVRYCVMLLVLSIPALHFGVNYTCELDVIIIIVTYVLVKLSRRTPSVPR